MSKMLQFICLRVAMALQHMAVSHHGTIQTPKILLLPYQVLQITAQDKQIPNAYIAT